MDGLNVCDFESAGREVLAYLHKRMGFDLWMLTRTEGDQWIVLQSEDHGYGITPGSVFSWADSFCAEMVKGNGPRIAPSSQDIPAYAAAPIGHQVQIGAYVGLPLTRTDGSLFGTLCAIHPSSLPLSIVHEQELVELLGAMLSTILQAELATLAETRKVEQLQTEALTDVLTQMYNRRGWDKFLDAEEKRCRRFGHSAAVLVIDLDELSRINDADGHAAGDALIVRAAKALRRATRSPDVVARLGGDEFGILSAECNDIGGDALLERVQLALHDENVNASVGLALRIPSLGLQGAWEVADKKMYEAKRARHQETGFQS